MGSAKGRFGISDLKIEMKNEMKTEMKNEMKRNPYIKGDQKHMRRTTPWNEKSARQKAGSIGLLLGIFLACTILAYAAVQLFGSKSARIANHKGHTFEMDLTGVNGGTDVVPGDTQNLSNITVVNKSSTDSVYAFIEFDYNPAVYEVSCGAGWEVVKRDDGSVVYSYSDGGEMTEVERGNSAVFNGTMTCIAGNDVFQELQDSDMIVDVTGFALSTSLCGDDSGNSDVWAKYQEEAGK